MAVRTQLFAATHAEALRRAEALDRGAEAGAAGLELVDISALDLETLGEIAARGVRFGSGDLEIADVDLEHESLLRFPPFLSEVLVELGQAEDPDLPAEVAAEWASTEEMSLDDGEAVRLVADIVALVGKAQAAGLDVYVWVAEA